MYAVAVVLSAVLGLSKPLGWAHIPKTSSAFGYAVGRVNCHIPASFLQMGPAVMHEWCISSGFPESGMWL